MLRPLPIKFGVGFTIPDSDFDNLESGLLHKHLKWIESYGYQKVGDHHNYYVTSKNWSWPNEIQIPDTKFVIDGFSPNLNKSLHVGHLRNLAIANSLSKILSFDHRGVESHCYKAKFVAMLGASLGVKKFAIDGWRYWTNFLNYKPEEYFDVALPDDLIKTHDHESLPQVVNDSTSVIEDATQKAQIWDGPNGGVIVKRSDGKPLYAFHDLSFAAYVGPTHYITGHEQKEHFSNLGLGDKHLPMGLVLGEDNKKLKSRTGDAIAATEVVDMLTNRLEGDLDVKTRLAWNILAWNFLRTTREKNIKFDVENWTRPDQGGLYISYTYARAVSALGKKGQSLTRLYSSHDFDHQPQEIDISLLGFSEQYRFYYQESVNRLDSAPIANFAFDLAKMISQAYEKEKINGGRRSYGQAFEHAAWRLGMCMKDLGMFQLCEV